MPALLPILLANAHAGLWSDGDCAGCHPAVAARLSTSRHALSASNLNYVTATKHASNRTWCASCHQPRGAPVGCASCHDDHEPVEPDVCASCHQVPAPAIGPPLRFGGDLLQATWDEWRALESPEPCWSCHLDGHRFPGAHDPALVRSAITVEATATALRIATTSALGHRFPTGDPFRRVSIDLCADSGCEDPVAGRSLGIVHTADDAGWARVTHDSRLGPPGSPWPDQIEVPRSQAASHYRVLLHLSDPALALPASEAVLQLATGVFP